MTDYAQLIDEETWAFIERTNAYYPPDAVDYTVAQQREIYDRMCQAFFVGLREDVTATDAAIPAQAPARSIPIRIYRKATAAPQAVTLYFHGGGFILGGLDSHHDVCAELCARTSHLVVSVDYRLSPEHLYPASHQDGYPAFEWATSEFGLPIVLSGDSAGGNIAAAIAGRFRAHAHAPVGQMLIYPGLGGDRSRGSYVRHAHAPMLTTRDLDFYGRMRTGNTDVTEDAGFAPLCDGDFSGLPPTVIITAECDPLSSDGEAYRDAILAAGGTAIWVEEKGLVHGYLRARNTVQRARRSFERIVEATVALGSQAPLRIQEQG